MEKISPLKGLFTKWGRWLALAFLVLAAILALLFIRPRGGDTVRIYLGGVLYEEVPLNRDRVILLEQPGGERNELVIEGGKVWMQAASCHNQDCVHQSPLRAEGGGFRALGNWIICLPNRVSVELAMEDKG